MKSQIGEFNLFEEELKAFATKLQAQIDGFITEKKGYYEDIDDKTLAIAVFSVGASLCATHMTMYYKIEKGIPLEQELTKSQIEEVLVIVGKLNRNTEQTLREHLTP